MGDQLRAKRGIRFDRNPQRLPDPRHQVVLLVGPTGTGKTWLACALGQSACRQGHAVRYSRLPRLLGEELVRARADGSYGKLLQQLAKTDLSRHA